MSIPSADFQLAFLRKIQRVFEEGEFVATYKLALLCALAELSVEKGDGTDAPLHLSLDDIATKFIELYWRQVKPYKSINQSDGILKQIRGGQAAIPNLVLKLQAQFSSLTEAKSSRQWSLALSRVASVVETMPLWKLQTLRRQKVIFLYPEELVGSGITLFQGVSYCFRQFNGFILQLARSSWVGHLKDNPQNRLLLGDDSDLESFLFGSERTSLAYIRELLGDIQAKKCFYCGKGIRDAGAVDHFIPWARYPRDITQNFVLAHQGCNNDKSDLLAATRHLVRWRERNEKYKCELRDFKGMSIVTDENTSLSVARWAYGQAFDAKSQVWVEMKVTEMLMDDFLQILA